MGYASSTKFMATDSVCAGPNGGQAIPAKCPSPGAARLLARRWHDVQHPFGRIVANGLGGALCWKKP